MARRYTGLTISSRGETGGERPQKTDSKFDPLQTTGGGSSQSSRNRVRDPNSPSGVSEAEDLPRLALLTLRWLPRLIEPGSQRRRSPARTRIGRINERYFIS
jgi:hypothetical protein